MMLKKSILIPLIAGLFFLVGSNLMAQGPPEPPGNVGQTGDQPAGGPASLAGGIGILLSLGAAYGAGKIYKTRKNKSELDE